MRETRSFLVVAEDTERLALIANTLHRKFAHAVVHTCRESEAAIAVTKAQRLDAIVAHRSTDMDEIPLIEHLRAATSVPIVGMSNHHAEEQVLAAGASRHLHSERWLLVGTVVGDLIGAQPLAKSSEA